MIEQAEKDGAIQPVEPKPVTRTFTGSILATLTKMRQAADSLPPLPDGTGWSVDTTGGVVGDNCRLTVTWTPEEA